LGGEPLKMFFTPSIKDLRLDDSPLAPGGLDDKLQALLRRR